MATLLVNVKLKDGVDQNSFVSEFDSVSEVTVKNLLPNIPTLVIFNVEDSYLSTLQSHSSVEFAEEEPQSFPTVTYPSQPSAYTCLLYTSPSPRDSDTSRMPSSA